MSYLRYLCLYAYSDVKHIVLCFCIVFLRLVYPVLPVFLGGPFLIIVILISVIL